MRKVLITGASGQLGQELIKVFSNDWQVIPTDTYNLDITNSSQTLKTVSTEKPDLIINSAAYTDVEGAAKSPQLAMKINGEGTKNIAQAAKEVGALLVYISTNEVFDGTKEKPYIEIDQTNPLNPYAVSKLAGEKFCQEILGDNFLIARTSWLYGPESKVNFPNKIINRAIETGKLEVVDDEVSTPTYAPDLAGWIKEVLDKEQRGIFHLVNSGFSSRYQWAEQIVKKKNLKVELKRTKLANYQRLSTPPKRAVLSNSKAKSVGLELRNWEEASSEYLKQVQI